MAQGSPIQPVRLRVPARNGFLALMVRPQERRAEQVAQELGNELGVITTVVRFESLDQVKPYLEPGKIATPIWFLFLHGVPKGRHQGWMEKEEAKRWMLGYVGRDWWTKILT